MGASVWAAAVWPKITALATIPAINSRWAVRECGSGVALVRAVVFVDTVCLLCNLWKAKMAL